MQFITEAVKVCMSSGAKGTERTCSDNWPIVTFDTNDNIQSI